MFADIIGMPVTVAECQETGALGAAISAGVAAGIFPSLDAGIAAMVRRTGTYMPREERRALIESRYRLFHELAGELPARWKRYVGEASGA